MRKTVLALAFAAALIATGCGGDDGGGDAGGNGNGGDAATTVTARDFAFAPTSVTVEPGEVIEVENTGEASHTFTVEEGEEHLIDVEISPGATENVTVDVESGEYEFYCRFHPQMTGTLTVQ